MSSIINFILINKYRLLILSLLIILSPYIYISFFAQPIADDFTYAFKGKNYEIIEILKHEFFNWNGRYSSNLFVILNPIVFNSFVGYKLIPVFSILLTLFSFYFFVSAVSDLFTKTEKLSNSLILTLLYLYQMPIISEGIYWYTGLVTYHLGNILLLLILTLFFKYFKNKFIINKYMHQSIIFILIFIIIGLNEVIMLNLLIYSFVCFFIAYIRKFQSKHFLILLFAFSIICSAIVFFAPGNNNREALFFNNHNFTSSFINSIIQTFRFIFEWLSSIPLIIVSIFYFFINKQLSAKEFIFKNSFFLTPIISTLLIFITVFVCIFPAYWATGILGQQRSVNVAYFLFLILWFINLTVVFNNLKGYSIHSHLTPEIKLFAVLLMLISFSVTKNGLSLITDIAYSKEIQYNKLMTDRCNSLSIFNRNSTDTIYLKKIPNPPKTLFILDITENSECWMNKGYNVYFELENKIVAK